MKILPAVVVGPVIMVIGLGLAGVVGRYGNEYFSGTSKF